jgi:hypothetical protein
MTQAGRSEKQLRNLWLTMPSSSGEVLPGQHGLRRGKADLPKHLISLKADCKSPPEQTGTNAELRGTL